VGSLCTYRAILIAKNRLAVQTHPETRRIVSLRGAYAFADSRAPTPRFLTPVELAEEDHAPARLGGISMSSRFLLISCVVLGLAGSALAQTTPAGTPNVNPLLTAWTTPFEVPPFRDIKPEHFLPAIK
jgi:hypothetical protein